MPMDDRTDRERSIKRRQFVKVTGLAGVAAVAGCAGEETPEETPAEEPTEEPTEEPEPETPDPTETQTALIEPDTLAAWQDEGLVNAARDGEERVTVLRVFDTEGYEDGHVPGAMPWGALHGSRMEALTALAPTVPDGEAIDEMLQRTGVDENTTIVLSGPNPLRAARAYFTLRYWGFPRERIKILNGGYTAYDEEFGLETGGEPDVSSSAFSVQDNGDLNADLRVSLGEMIQKVDAVNDGETGISILDNRPHPSATIANAVVDPPSNYHEGPEYHSDAPWKDADEIEEYVFDLDGVSDGDEIVTYCGSGYRATMSFFALDGVLGYDDVAVYDGSFSFQWQHYDGDADVVPNDAWRTDLEGRTDGDTGESQLEVIPSLNEAFTDATDPDANQIEQEDQAYMAGDEYEPAVPEPDPTETDNALIDPETLKEYQARGMVNRENTDGRERVVVLRAFGIDEYEDGHVPGAVPWETVHQTRFEALSELSPTVPDGATMDELLQRAGVCNKTTIVISAPAPLRAARAYFTLRYWGFPRDRVKVLNGGYTAYEEAYGLAEGDEPNVPTTTFSVQDNDDLNDDLRLSLGETIQKVDAVNDGETGISILDNRPDPDATLANAVVDPPSNYHEGPEYFSDAPWKSADEIESYVFDLDGVSDGDEIVTYCGSGYRATMSFFALDGVLGYDDVAVYDGSFSRQWQHYDGNADVVPNDAWRVDLEGRTDGDTGASSLDIDPDLNEELTDLTDPDANQIEQEDLAYMAGETAADPDDPDEDDQEDDDGDDGGDGGLGGGCPAIPAGAL